MALAGALEIEMFANVARLAKDMNQAKSAVGSAMGNINSAVSGATKILGALGVGMSVNHFAKLIQNSINAQDALNDMSQKIGVSVERLAGLDHAAKLNGTSLETVQKALKTVSAQALDASRGLAASQENFDALGISVVDASGNLKSADKIMLEVADSFGALTTETEKTALANKLFGKSGLDLIPMLNEGSAGIEAMIAAGQKYNPVTKESALQADELNDNLERLKGTASAVGVSFTNSLLPGLVGASDAILEFTQSDEMEKWGERAKTAAEVLAIVLAARLVPAIVLSGHSAIAAAIETMRYQAALASMAGVSVTTAIAQTGLATATGVLNGALMIVGGPVGALVLIAGGLALMISKMESAKESTARLLEEMDELSRAELERGITIQEAYVQGLQFRIDKLEASSKSNKAAQSALAELNHELIIGQKELQELQRGMKGV